MSKRRNRRPPSHKSTAVMEREQPQESRVARQPQIKPGGVNFTPVTDKVIQAMYQHMGPQKNTDTLYAPGAPIKPIPALLPPEGPRVWAYPAGYNVAQLPRATEQYSFADLRALASMYDGIQLCQQVWFDYVSRLELVIEPREELIDEDEDISIYQDDILKYIEFFSEPDKDLNFHEWLCKAVHEQLEIDALAIYVRKDRAGRPFSLDIIDGSCYNDEMEILTKAGWKRFDEVNLDTDLFATRNPETKAFEWQKATYFHEADWDSDELGNLYHFSSRSLDLLVTPNHRMVVSNIPRNAGGSRHRQPGEFILTAKELAEGIKKTTMAKIPATSAWDAPDVEEVRIPATTPRSREMVFSGDDFAAFMGMWIAEGCAPNGDQVYITQSPKSKGFQPFKELIDRIWGRSVCHTGTNFVIGHKALHDYLKQFGYAHEKFVPDIILNMSSRQLAIFWHYYVLGDGGYDKSKDGTIRERITTVSKELVDDLQEVLQKMGYSGSITFRHDKHDSKMANGYTIKAENQRPTYVLSKRTSAYQNFNVERLPYKGKVYCVSVPNEILYVRRNGKPAWCGNTIKPLIDDRGRKPQLPYPAYEQYWRGLPAAFLTSDDLIYVKETQRTDSVYGRSRVERIILGVNQALRKQTKDLARFTDGNVPAGVIEVAMDVQWSQEEIEAYEIQFNNLMAGNDEMRARIKVMPRGFVYKPTDDPDVHIDLDQFILTRTAGCHGLTLDELAMTTTSNRSVGQTQENVVYRRAMGPLMGRYAKLLTHILRKFFKEHRFVVKLRGYEEKEDFNTMAGAYATLTTAGIQSPTQAARAMHLPVWQDVEVPPFIVPKGGQPIMIEDLANPELHKAQLAAQMAGLELAKTNPGGTQPQDTTSEEGDEEENDTQPQQQQKGQAGAGKKPNSSGNTDHRQGSDGVHQSQGKGKEEGQAEKRAVSTDDYGIWRKGTCECSACQINDGVVRKAGDAFPSGAYNVGDHEGCDCRIEPYAGIQREEESPAVQRLMAEVAAILKRLDATEKAPSEHTGIMVAFMLDSQTAKQLSLPNGESTNDLHITLCFLGDKSEYGEDFSALTRAVSDFATDATPLIGNVSGLARFAPSESSDGKVPVVALVNARGIQRMHETLVKHLGAYGYRVASDFEYTPHVTLAYLDEGKEMPCDAVPQLPLILDTITLCVGDERTSFKLGQQPIPTVSERDIVVELNRWRARAMDDIKRGHALRGFTTTILPEGLHMHVEAELEACQTVDAVKEVFRQAKSGEGLLV